MPYVEPYHRGLKRTQTIYGRPWSQIMSCIIDHRRLAGRLITDMIEVRDRYNADWVLPELEEYGDLNPLIVADVIDQLGMAAAQADYNVYVPAIEPLKKDGVRSIEYADVRRKILDATDHASAFDVGRGRAYRQLFAYATYSLMVVPDFQNEHMRITVADPITTYTEPKDPEDLTPPGYGAVVFGLSASDLLTRWPDAAKQIGGVIPAKLSIEQLTQMWDVVRWWDPECMVIGILGPRDTWTDTRRPEILASNSMELRRVPNRIGFTPIQCPTQVTLDRIMSASARITGRADLMAKYEALDLYASEKSVVPDKYLIGAGGQAPRMVKGRWLDGRSGEVNELVNVQGVGEMRGTPDPSGKIAHDRLEGDARRHAGTVPQMQGETYGALRTGRGIDALYGAATDPRLTEAHRIMQHAKTALNRAVLAGYKGYWGSKSFSMYSGRQGDSYLSFMPDVHIEVVRKADEDGEGEQLAVENAVVYPIPGADVLNLTMAIGQMRAMGVLPLADALRMHPWVPDAPMAQRRLLVEDFENIAKAALAQRMAPGGGMHPLDLATLLEYLAETGDIPGALRKADELASLRAATIAPEPAPGQIAAPETMPGIGLPGEGGEQPAPPPAIAGPNDAQANFKSLSLALKSKPPANSPVPAGAI